MAYSKGSMYSFVISIDFVVFIVLDVIFLKVKK